MSLTIMHEGIISTIGDTPLIELKRVAESMPFRLFAKLEGFNPGGSTKDRAAVSIIRHALANRILEPGMTVIESTSGNMGIGLALVCAYYDFHLICVVDPKTTPQNVNLLRAYGAEIDFVTEPDPVTGKFLPARLARVQELLHSRTNGFWPDQYANMANATAHYRTMQEIAEALEGNVDFVFCSTSTCGTIRGCSEYVSHTHSSAQIYAVDAEGSVIFGKKDAPRLIPGLGSDRRPELLNPALIHGYVSVTDMDCIMGCRRLVKAEAILAGGSSGGVLAAVGRVREIIPEGANCVVIFPDRGERYLDTIYSDTWLEQHFGEAALAEVTGI